MSGHYYTTKGEPRHFIPIKSGKKKGQQRPTTLRDAKKHGWLPSVSAYTEMLGKPHLVPWKARQVLSYAYDAPPIGNESREGWIGGIMQKVEREHDATVMDRGTALHAAIESILSGGTCPADLLEFAMPVAEVVWGYGKVWACERVVVSGQMGYAGTSDCILYDGSILDFKTKDFKGKDEATPSFEHAMQLAAYSVAWHQRDAFPPCHNIYFDRNVPGKIFVKTWTPQELAEGWEAFKACQVLYRITKGYDARQ